MNGNCIREQLNEFYAISKEADALYSAFAKRSGLSDTAFWILYFIRVTKDECTQKIIREQWSMSKQTVNSAIYVLTKNNLITLSESKSDKRSKKIVLTEKGEEFAQNNIDIIYQLEYSVFGQMTDCERRDLIANNRKFLKLFRLEINNLLN